MDKKIIEKLQKNTNWFDLYYEESKTTPISFKNSKLYSVNEKQSSGYGIRVNKNDKTGFSYSNSAEYLEDAADKALALAKYGDAEKISLPENSAVSKKIILKGSKEFNVQDEMKKAEEAITKIKHQYKDADVDISLRGGSGSQWLRNSNTLFQESEFSFYSASVSATLVSKTGVRTETWASKTALDPQGIADLAEEVLQRLKWSETVEKLSNGKYPVVFSHKGFASLLGILTSGLSARAHYKKVSPFCDKIGEKMFDEKLTVIDNPLLENSIYSYEFDDEGVASKSKNLIDQGKINSLVSNLKYASLLGVEPSGNASRGYASQPSSSFSNLIVEGGKDSLENMISKIECGILAEQFIGLGQSNTITGDFSANIDLGYLIKDGKIVGRVKDCMLTDNLFELLKNNIELSSDQKSVGNSTVPALYCKEVNFTS